ncbi:PP2C family protein-serine/threonine phosphatase [Saccharothrix violaceirubra]|uniref:Serine phosphatase RsbU (Regulator of sigma subunit) n=1 Tax=Saccharothrix violaceirubra TaxID=413306 RepID=A0A7W7WX28_9PSEU|nr:PP2C family protein-serine/threonine phosphatase [Saccharothrix violaceirubra]MBB4966632.1 serine phosphatase RsbU (regulator of sigma subunit) [Saccharothrix violaceirubra]
MVLDDESADAVEAPTATRQAPVDPVPAARERTVDLLDAFAVAVVVVDANGVVLQATAEALRLLPRLVVGMPLERFPHDGVEVGLGDRIVVGTRRALPDGTTAWQFRDVTAQRAREDALLAERARSRFLARAGSRLGLSLNPARSARAVVELAGELAFAATVVLPGGEYVHGERDAALRVGRWTRESLPVALVEAMDGTAGGVERHPADLFAAGRWLPHVDTSRVAEAVTVPLPGTDLPGPVLVLWRPDTTSDTASGTGSDIEDPHGVVLAEFAARAGMALSTAEVHARQAHTAAVLKENLLPGPLPEVDGLAFGAEYRPATGIGSLGGDFYEVVPTADGTSFVFGDVVGTGVEAAVTSGVVRQSLGALRRVAVDAVRSLAVLNESLLAEAPGDRRRFATVVLGLARPLPGGGARLSLTGGGHLAPLVLRASGAVEFVEVGGMLVGAVADATFRSAEIDLAPGETCVLYSDGVTEARGGVDGTTLFGQERLAALMADCARMPAVAVAERVALGAQQWIGGAEHDDLTVLAVRATPRKELG